MNNQIHNQRNGVDHATQGGLIQLSATDTLSVQFSGNTGDVIAANESAISIYFVSI